MNGKLKTLAVHTSGKKPTQISRQKAKYAYNARFIQDALNVTPSEYNEWLFEIGMLFLENYWCIDEGYEETYFNQFAKDKELGFWDWFLAQFKIYEHLFLKTKQLSAANYSAFALSLPNNEQLHREFYNHFFKNK